MGLQSFRRKHAYLTHINKSYVARKMTNKNLRVIQRIKNKMMY